MVSSPPRRPPWLTAACLLVGCLLAVSGCQRLHPDPAGATSASPSTSSVPPGPGEPDNQEGVEVDVDPGVAPVPPADPVTCPSATTTVTTARELTSALAHATPGDVIRLARGTYQGSFTAAAQGSPDQPIWLCGDRGAVLDGDGPQSRSVLRLRDSSYWRLVGFSVRNGQKGVMLDTVTHSVVQDLAISDIGDEALHLRRFSTDNLVLGNDISRTGLRIMKYGEGIYIGSSVNNWCALTDCLPDRSDRNMIAANRISDTAAENIDIKEGTTSGQLRNNVLNGAGTMEPSVVDVKGTAWLIAGNIVRDPPIFGFQTHVIEPRWGARILFEDNTVVGPAREGDESPPYAIALRPDVDSTVRCSNTAEDLTLSTVACRTS